MPPKCSICTNKKKGQIDSAIRQGVSLRNIAQQFKLSTHYPVYRHATKCLSLDLSSYFEQVQQNRAIDYHASLAKQHDYVTRLLDASEDWLTVDGQIDLSPRSEEIKVVYLDYNDKTDQGEPKRKTASLDSLLAQVNQGKEIVSAEAGITDIRKLATDYMKECRATLSEFAKVQGLYMQDRENPANFEIRVGQMAMAAMKLMEQVEGMHPQDAVRLIAERYVHKHKQLEEA